MYVLSILGWLKRQLNAYFITKIIIFSLYVSNICINKLIQP